MNDAGGWLWLVVDVFGVAILAAGIFYGMTRAKPSAK
jgi:hypothetical protein